MEGQVDVAKQKKASKSALDEFDLEFEKLKKNKNIKIKPLDEVKKNPGKKVNVTFAPKPIKSKAKKENKPMKKSIIITIVATALVTLSLVFGGFKLHEFVYNSGVKDEKARHQVITDEVVKSVQKLEESKDQQ